MSEISTRMEPIAIHLDEIDWEVEDLSKVAEAPPAERATIEEVGTTAPQQTAVAEGEGEPSVEENSPKCGELDANANANAEAEQSTVIVEEPDDQVKREETPQSGDALDATTEGGSIVEVMDITREMNGYVDNLYGIVEEPEEQVVVHEQTIEAAPVQVPTTDRISIELDRKDDKMAELLRQLYRKNMRVQRVRGDGACLFRAISYMAFGTEDEHYIIRQRAMDFVDIHRKYYLVFVLHEEFDEYIARKRKPSTFGNHIEIQAIAEIFHKIIEIYSPGSQSPIVIQGAKVIGRPFRMLYDGSHFDAIVGIDEEPEFKRNLPLLKYGGEKVPTTLRRSPRLNHGNRSENLNRTTLEAIREEQDESDDKDEGERKAKIFVTDKSKEGTQRLGRICRYCLHSARPCSRHLKDQ